MEGPSRTPLLDYFRRGEAPVDIRLLAARGMLAPPAHEQLELLRHLLKDADSEVAASAEATLQSIPTEAISAFLERWRTRCATYGIDYVRVFTDTPLDAGLRAYLRRRAIGGVSG